MGYFFGSPKLLYVSPLYLFSSLKLSPHRFCSPSHCFYSLLRAEREARSESTSIYRRKVSMSGRPAVVMLFERLFLWNGMTNSRMVILIRCHHQINHVFDRYRYPPVPATARGTCTAGEGVEDTLSLGNSTTAGPIAFKFGV